MTRDTDLQIGAVVFNDNHPSMPSRVDVNVQNNLAPIADHLRLLQEMRKTVENEIVHTFNVQNSIVSVAGYVTRVAFPLDIVKVLAIYKLNEKEYRYEKEFSMHSLRVNGIQEFANDLLADITRSVALIVTESLGTTLMESLDYDIRKGKIKR